MKIIIAILVAVLIIFLGVKANWNGLEPVELKSSIQ